MKQALFWTFLLVYAATAFVTILGITGKLTMQAEYLDKLFYLLIIESIAPVITLFKKTTFFGDKQAASELVQGCWWQFVLYQRENAISFVQIYYSKDQQQLVVDGRSFDAAGEPFAQWWSDGASINAATLELRYFWKGDHTVEEGDFSGVGGFRFKRKESGARISNGAGWFTSGNIDQLDVTRKQKVEIQKASDDHCKVMLSEDNLKEQSEVVKKVLSSRA